MTIRALRRGAMSGRGAAPGVPYNLNARYNWDSDTIKITCSSNPTGGTPVSAVVKDASNVPRALTYIDVYSQPYEPFFSATGFTYAMTGSFGPLTVIITFADGTATAVANIWAGSPSVPPPPARPAAP